MDNLFYDASDAGSPAEPPNVNGAFVLIDGVLRPWTGVTAPVPSPIRRRGVAAPKDEIVIGTYAMCDSKTALEAVDSAVKAYDYGRGAWPQLKPWDRIKHVQRFALAMKARREQVRNSFACCRAVAHAAGSWSTSSCGRFARQAKTCGVCKGQEHSLALQTRSDSEKEVDRTIVYINETINELTKMENSSNGVTLEGGIVSQVKRSPLGVGLICGPFNYPLNGSITS